MSLICLIFHRANAASVLGERSEFPRNEVSVSLINLGALHSLCLRVQYFLVMNLEFDHVSYYIFIDWLVRDLYCIIIILYYSIILYVTYVTRIRACNDMIISQCLLYIFVRCYRDFGRRDISWGIRAKTN